jgi:hypothetical protein
MCALLGMAGCHQGGSGTEADNRQAANDNRLIVNPTTQTNLSAYVDSVSLWVGGAEQSIKAGDWQAAMNNLQGSKEKIDKALADPAAARVSAELNDLRKTLQRAVNAVESHSGDSLGLVLQAQTAVNALKVRIRQ